MIVFSGTRTGASGTGSGECETTSDRAGIAQLWAIPCAAIASLRFDRERRVVGISFFCGVLSDQWVPVLFEPGTGQFQQTQRGVNRYDQSISVIVNGQTAYNRRQINALSACSCWHFVVLDEAGVYHYAGAHTYDRGSLTVWESAALSASGNVASTGINPESGVSDLRIVLTARGVHQLAPHLTDEPDVLRGDCLNRAVSSQPPVGGDGGDNGGGSGGGGNETDNWQTDAGADWQTDGGEPWT